MLKFLRGLIIWQVMKNNFQIVKRLLFSFAAFAISLYFFPDWEDYFTKRNNLDMLLYTKLTKYLFLITSGVLFLVNIKKLSLLGKKEKEKKGDNKGDDKGLIETHDPDIETIRSKEKLRSKSDVIKEKYKKES
tara:strand:- start:826 stop:1224 length:399 start_codon:yes stop_codon:yes gene_type:complete